MEWDKKPHIALVSDENTNKNNIFASMSLDELLAALEIILQAEMICQDEIYEPGDKQGKYLH